MRIQNFIDLSPSFKIYLSASKINRSIQADLQDVTFLQAMILLAIYFEKGGSVQPKQLAQTLEVSRSLMSHNLSYLEGIKFVKRTSLTQDARCFSMALTPTGMTTVKRLVRYFDDIQKRTENLFSEEGAKNLSKQIEAVASLHK